MADIQRERLRHLVSNAIHELWKKESGSMSSVLIEGTICITAGSGRTTVVQVNNKYSGSLPECDKESGDNIGRSSRGLYCPRYSSSGYVPTSLDFRQVNHSNNNTSAVQAYFDELSPASLISPASETPGHDSNNNPEQLHTESALQKSSGLDSGIDVTCENEEKPSEYTVDKIKEDFLSEDEEDSLNDSRNSNAGPVCPGTGYYTAESRQAGFKTDRKRNSECMKIEANNNKQAADECRQHKDESGVEEFSVSEGPGPMMSTPKPPKHSRKTQDFSLSGSLNSSLNDPSLALDLTKKEDDLALSSPQNYTAQVRDVIRQRLLAQRSMDESTDRDDSNLSTEGSPALSSSAPALLGNPSPVANLPHFSPSLLQHLPKHLQLPPHLSSSMLRFYDYTNMFSNATSKSHPHAIQELLSGTYKKSTIPPLLPLERPTSTEPINLAQESASNDNQSVASDKESLNGEQKVYKCDYCSKTFLFKSKYNEHLPVHTNARPFQCRLCSRTYKYKYDLRVHLRTHMGIPTKSTVCPFCNAKFDTNKLLRLHIKDAHKERHKSAEQDCAQLYEGVL